MAVKNRDRNYVPDISFKETKAGDNTVLYFWDDITQYCEGINSAGIGVLSASLMVLDDEKEITVRSSTPSKDGAKIKAALRHGDIDAVAMSLIKAKLPGNTIICNHDTCYLLEGCWKPGGYSDEDYDFKIRKIPQNETIARTNHGVWLPWAGYQPEGRQSHSPGPGHSMSRISSESRLLIAKAVVDAANSPEDMIDGLTRRYVDNDQLNAFRTTGDRKKMRTTAQIMLEPRDMTMYVRPVQSNLSFNYWDHNRKDKPIWVELLSNRILRSSGDPHPWPKMAHKV